MASEQRVRDHISKDDLDRAIFSVVTYEMPRGCRLVTYHSETSEELK